MPKFICVTCGTQFPESDAPPAHCPICEDERQYIPAQGQQWTTMETLQQDRRNVFHEVEPGMPGIVTEPKVAIGQRAVLIQRPGGNILWECISYIDKTTIEQVNALGGVTAIAISHPHFYSSMVEWSRALGAPVYLHESNRPFVMNPDPCVRFWDGETYSLGDDVTLIRAGGHFPGSTVLHWRDGADGRGVLLTGDTIYPVQDSRYVTFMYSYPNMIPLPPVAVERIAAAVAPYQFERVYGSWADRVVTQDGKAAVERSARRYVEILTNPASYGFTA